MWLRLPCHVPPSQVATLLWMLGTGLFADVSGCWPLASTKPLRGAPGSRWMGDACASLPKALRFVQRACFPYHVPGTSGKPLISRHRPLAFLLMSDSCGCSEPQKRDLTGSSQVSGETERVRVMVRRLRAPRKASPRHWEWAPSGKSRLLPVRPLRLRLGTVERIRGGSGPGTASPATSQTRQPRYAEGSG